jgi:hypothetical protein
VNLARQRPEQVARMEAELWRRLGVGECRELAMAPPGQPSDAARGLQADQVEALEALGYLE